MQKERMQTHISQEVSIINLSLGSSLPTVGFDWLQAAGRLEIMVGWYHSHPGYGCWLSGIDCSTQLMQQQYQDPFLAIVVDPHRTIASGKVEIGAFRTYPQASQGL